jgi:uncharacterized protein
MYDLIHREKYIDQVLPFIHKDLIKVFIGQRRVGKSYILKQLMNHLIKVGIEQEQIIFIDKEKYEFDEVKNYHDLIEFVQNRKNTNKRQYLFIDEVQEIEKFELALREFNSDPHYDVYCTGSNANILSTELATRLSGRYIEFNIYPLSYIEFLKFHKLDKSNESLASYYHFGGLPYLIHLDLQEDIVNEYKRSVINSIILKDIVSRHSIRNTNFLQRLILFLADNIGQITSAKKISDFLKSQNMKISPSVVLNYIDYLCEVFLIYKVKRYDIVGKRVFEIGEKYYFNDLGLRNSLVGFKGNDISKLLENLVFNKLLSDGYEVHVGNINHLEIDFICKKGSDLKYIQVVYLLNDDKVVEREFSNLEKIPDNYEKIVLSMDPILIENRNGIKHLNIIDFLVI